jgi:hypothetical protein
MAQKSSPAQLALSVSWALMPDNPIPPTAGRTGADLRVVGEARPAIYFLV